MNFGAITKAVHDAWQFAWPPLVMCLTFYLVARYLNPEGTRETIIALVQLIQSYGSKVERAKTLLEPFGLVPLIPIISAFVVVGFLYLINAPIGILASKLPPTVSYRPDMVAARAASLEDKVALIRRFPGARSFSVLYPMAIGVYDVSKKRDGRNRASLNFKFEGFLKFALLSALVLVGLNIRSGASPLLQSGRLIVLLALLSVAWAINFVFLLRNQEQEYYEEWNLLMAEVQKEKGAVHPDSMSEKERAVAERMKLEGQGRWWYVRLVDPYWWTWLRATFFPK